MTNRLNVSFRAVLKTPSNNKIRFLEPYCVSFVQQHTTYRKHAPQAVIWRPRGQSSHLSWSSAWSARPAWPPLPLPVSAKSKVTAWGNAEGAAENGTWKYVVISSLRWPQLQTYTSLDYYHSPFTFIHIASLGVFFSPAGQEKLLQL